MPAEFILSVDQGTTNTKALLISRSGQPVFQAACAVRLLQPQPGWIEQDPAELWESAQSVMRDCAAEATRRNGSISGITLSNQRETAIAWRRKPSGDSRNGEALCNAISWQCRRSEDVCRRVSASQATLRSRTGLPLDPLISATKWAWMLANNACVKEAALSGELALGNVDSWLLYNLTGGDGHATEHSNASRTGLLNLETLEWDEELLTLFGIPGGALPRIKNSADSFGNCTGIPSLEGVPIVAILGDSHAAMSGHGIFTSGLVKATYGTGSSLMMLTEGLAKEDGRLSRTIAWSVHGKVQYALEANITMSGAAVQWVGEFLGLPTSASDAIALSETVPDAAGVVMVPAMVGLGAPYWNSEVRGIICNLGRSHTAAHLARAAVDAMAHQVADVYFAMEESAGTPLLQLNADGGATRNGTLMQLQADLIDRPVVRSGVEELSALGVARLGGVTLGWWPDLQSSADAAEADTIFKPRMTNEARKILREAWSDAVTRACSGTGETRA